MELVACPEPGCGVVAEVSDRFVLPSTEGAVEHMRTRCLRGHVLVSIDHRCHAEERAEPGRDGVWLW